jgi:hypothetical protein
MVREVGQAGREVQQGGRRQKLLHVKHVRRSRRQHKRAAAMWGMSSEWMQPAAIPSTAAAATVAVAVVVAVAVAAVLGAMAPPKAALLTTARRLVRRRQGRALTRGKRGRRKPAAAAVPHPGGRTWAR